MKRLSWKAGCLAVILACVAVYYGYRFSEGELPLSSLPVQATDVKPKESEIDYSSILWPPFGEQPYPPLSNSAKVFSPDSQYYIQLVKFGWRNRRWVCLFESATHHRLGCYSFHDLIIYRWAEDSSGVYLSDYVPGKGALFIIEPSRPAYISPVKKVLVPCRGSLAGVALLPRLYWEMRCAFLQPYSFAAIWLPLVVVMALVAVGGWLGVKVILWFWRRVVRTWWYGE